MEHWTEYTRFFIALLVILDPFAAVPIFLALTIEFSKRERARAAWMAALTVAVVLTIAALSGEAVLRSMGTSLASFRVGGGLVLFLMALALLRGQPGDLPVPAQDSATAAARHSIAVVPLAIPLLAGPGAISTVIIQAHRSGAHYHSALTVLVIVSVCVVIWLVLRVATRVGALLGPIGLNIINRLFGLILTAIAVEIMANGLKVLFPVLSR